MDYKLIISIAALILGVITFSWNVFNKIKSDSKKLLIQSYKSRSETEAHCVITITNIGNKPVYVRRIEIYERTDGRSKLMPVNYKVYREKFENKPINSEDWRTVIFYDNENLNFFDDSISKFKETKIVLVDSKNKKYKTKWFGQSNLR